MTRQKMLDAWLEKHNAHCMWQAPRERTRDPVLIEGWQIGKGVAIIVRYPHGAWDIFTNGQSGLVDETLMDAEKRLGLS